MTDASDSAAAPGPTDDGELAEVLSTTDPAERILVKSLLESSGIPFLVQGEEASSLLPVSTPGFFRDTGLAARFLVRADDLEEARELLASADGVDVDDEADDGEADDGGAGADGRG